MRLMTTPEFEAWIETLQLEFEDFVKKSFPTWADGDDAFQDTIAKLKTMYSVGNLFVDDKTRYRWLRKWKDEAWTFERLTNGYVAIMLKNWRLNQLRRDRNEATKIQGAARSKGPRSGAPPLEEMEREEQLTALRACAGKLPQEERNFWTDYERRTLSREEFAKQHDFTDEALKNEVRRIRQKIARCVLESRA